MKCVKCEGYGGQYLFDARPGVGRRCWHPCSACRAYGILPDTLVTTVAVILFGWMP